MASFSGFRVKIAEKRAFWLEARWNLGLRQGRRRYSQLKWPLPNLGDHLSSGWNGSRAGARAVHSISSQLCGLRRRQRCALTSYRSPSSLELAGLDHREVQDLVDEG
jgi:hypothetical protein